MCWSRGLAISRWRSLPDCLSVCLSVWAVRDVSTPIVGSGVEARLVEYGLGRDYARRCAMAGKPSAADTARIRPLPRPTPVRPGSCPHTGGHTGGSHGAGGPTGCRRSWLLRRSKAATRRSRGWRCVAPPPLHDSPIAHAVLMPMLCSCCAHSPRVPALWRRRRGRRRRGDAAAAAARRGASPARALLAHGGRNLLPLAEARAPR